MRRSTLDVLTSTTVENQSLGTHAQSHQGYTTRHRQPPCRIPKHSIIHKGHCHFHSQPVDPPSLPPTINAQKRQIPTTDNLSPPLPFPPLTFRPGAGCPSPPKSPHFQRTICQEGRSGRAGFLSIPAARIPRAYSILFAGGCFFFSFLIFFDFFLRRGEQGANDFRAKWWRGISRCGGRLWEVSGVSGFGREGGSSSGRIF